MRRMVAGAPLFTKTDRQFGVMRLGETTNSYKPVGKRVVDAIEAHGLIESKQESMMLIWTPTEKGRNSPGLISEQTP